ncbi:ATP-binding cassette, subfamily B [Filimonas lacunae]|uniref:ATP-binding cassette, subfamily B n=1 Tax=Filimonas lacunae TaxID=477680 RepID=A0A173MA32_9BACT|nr:peptidase domain-containing ABC transporter [Filimonas lacunae]BAV04397.1 ABC transporter ATP-binding protein [Filimonas lacunae]SIT31285.1 ATP-binding cassette, subfamily B [Filimonas lacunae]
MSFHFYTQLNSMDCGPTCLRMVIKHYGKHYSADFIRQQMGFSKAGVSLLGISDTAEKMGFRTRGLQINYKMLQNVQQPSILHWDQNHFVVLIEASKRKVRIADPAHGILMYTPEEFQEHWASNISEKDGKVGTVLMLEPTPDFYNDYGDKEKKLSWGIFTQYLRQNRWQISQVFFSLLLSSIIQLLLPFLTQTMVDTGINTQNLQYITIVLIAQLTLTFSNAIVVFIRSRLQLNISNSINLSLLSDFWIKLSRLPLSYFDSRHTGDTLQRINDNQQIQKFLTGDALSIIFSGANFLIYAVILTFYSVPLFLVFMTGNILYFGWIRLFLFLRRKINYQTFHLSATENNATLQLVQGMQEIRLNNAEKLKRWEWENIQALIYKLNFKSLNYNQWQSTGGLFITQGKDIILSFMVAKMVIEGQLTFGTMLAIQYIIGQLSSPVQQLIGLSQSIQDTKISMERLNEIHTLKEEEPPEQHFVNELPESKTLSIQQLSFTYPVAGSNPVLENISLTIPEGKTTAIVGVSGSGKTTLLKILLKVYEGYDGNIHVGNKNFRHLGHTFWRNQCGSVLQDGYIFNDSIARNIAVSDEYIDYPKLLDSCKIANILSFIETLPNGLNTKLGADGTGISQGQRQRILIARAVYKDPQYLFLDEATNALDANNEKDIVENLQDFFKGKTVIIVAHRLSTVKNADNVIVLHNGQVAEEGSHEYLASIQGKYYELVRNQLELGQ